MIHTDQQHIVDLYNYSHWISNKFSYKYTCICSSTSNTFNSFNMVILNAYINNIFIIKFNPLSHCWAINNIDCFLFIHICLLYAIYRFRYVLCVLLIFIFVYYRGSFLIAIKGRTHFKEECTHIQHIYMYHYDIYLHTACLLFIVCVYFYMHVMHIKTSVFITRVMCVEFTCQHYSGTAKMNSLVALKESQVKEYSRNCNNILHFVFSCEVLIYMYFITLLYYTLVYYTTLPGHHDPFISVSITYIEMDKIIQSYMYAKYFFTLCFYYCYACISNFSTCITIIDHENYFVISLFMLLNIFYYQFNLNLTIILVFDHG